MVGTLRSNWSFVHNTARGKNAGPLVNVSFRKYGQYFSAKHVHKAPEAEVLLFGDF